MIKTMTMHVDPAPDRRLEITLPRDIPSGPLDIVLVIAASEAPTAAVDLAGRWRDYFPLDFDLDGALTELRHEWELEWPETQP
ncbi:MAG: hypothetical protein WA040_23360 [Anaerolineae bacterium]